MKAKLFFKKTKFIWLSLGVLSLASLASLSIVSCSNSRNPEVVTSAQLTIGGTKLKRDNSGNYYCVDGTNINGFDKMPAIDKNNQATVEANMKFNVINVFGAWLQTFVLNYQNILSGAINDNNLFGLNDDISKQISIALGTPLGESTSAYRYSLQSINVGNVEFPNVSDLKVDQELTKDDKGNVQRKVADVKLTNISLTFNWWWSSNGNDVNFVNDSFDPNAQDKTLWNKYLENKTVTSVPKKTTINLNSEINLRIESNSYEKDGKHLFSGTYSVQNLADNKSPLTFGEYNEGNLNLAYSYWKIIEEANKYLRGDVNNETLKSFYEKSNVNSTTKLTNKQTFAKINEIFNIK